MPLNLEIDAAKLTDEEFPEIINRLEKLGNSEKDFCPQADFVVDYVWKDGEEYATSFTVKGWCYGSIYKVCWIVWIITTSAVSAHKKSAHRRE